MKPCDEKIMANLCNTLNQYLLDEEDYLLASRRLEENNPRIKYDLIRKELGLDDL